MKAIKIKKKRCKMIAHRGLCGLEKENTCSAFVAAAMHNYYGIETDVHVTKDGKFILCHDDDLKRVAGKDFVIEETEFAKLRRVKLFDKDGETRRCHLVLPTMEEYFSICKKYNKIAVFELKNRIPKDKIAEIVVKIKAIGWFQKTVFISFQRENLVDLRALEKTAKIQLLSGEYSEELFEFAVKYQTGLDVHFKLLSPEFIQKAHDLNIKVNAYVINDKTEAEKFVSYGLDFITTNILI